MPALDTLGEGPQLAWPLHGECDHLAHFVDLERNLSSVGRPYRVVNVTFLDDSAQHAATEIQHPQLASPAQLAEEHALAVGRHARLCPRRPRLCSGHRRSLHIDPHDVTAFARSGGGHVDELAIGAHVEAVRRIDFLGERNRGTGDSNLCRIERHDENGSRFVVPVQKVTGVDIAAQKRIGHERFEGAIGTHGHDAS